MPNRLGPNRFSPPLSLVWQIRHCRTKAALPFSTSPSAYAAPAAKLARANAASARITGLRAFCSLSPLAGRGGFSPSSDWWRGPLTRRASAPTSPRKRGEVKAPPSPATKALVRVLFVLNPISRPHLRMLPPARPCVVQLQRRLQRIRPVCSLSATDSKCIRMTLDYTDGDGIARRPVAGTKDGSQSSIFLPVPNRPPEESRDDHQTSILGRNCAWSCDAGSRRAD